MKIYSNIPTEILQFKYLPSQLAPDYQLQLVAHIENIFLLNEPELLPTNTINDENETHAQQILNFDINITVKYFQFENPEKFKKETIFHYDGVRSLIVKNGKYLYIKKYV